MKYLGEKTMPDPRPAPTASSPHARAPGPLPPAPLPLAPLLALLRRAPGGVSGGMRAT